MRVKLLTLRFSASLGGFDDAPLRELVGERDLLAFREHFFVVGEVPHLLCVITGASVPRAASDTAATNTHEARPLHRANGAGAVHGATASDSTHEQIAALDPPQRRLFDTLRAWRSRTAHHEGVPPYVVLTNRQLLEIVHARPACKTAIEHVDGFGEKKSARYGEAILAVLRDAATAPSAPAAAQPQETPA